MQDPAIAVVVDLHRRVDAANRLEALLAIIAFGAGVESWVLASIWNFALLDFRSLFFQFLISLGLFPIVAWMFMRWQQAFLPQD